MLRYIPNLTTAMLAFVIGVGGFYYLQPLKPSNAPVEGQNTTQPQAAAVSSASAPAPRDPPKPEQKVNYVCYDKLFLFVLDHLRKVEKEPDYVDSFIDGAGIVNCSELLKVEKRVDLNGDGSREIILRAQNSPKGSFFCGATGNCDHWVIRRDRKGYMIILDAPVTEEVRIQKGKRGGYYDLVTRYHGGMMDHTLANYSYGRGKYTLRKCFSDTMDTDGKEYIKRKKLSDCG